MSVVRSAVRDAVRDVARNVTDPIGFVEAILSGATQFNTVALLEADTTELASSSTGDLVVVTDGSYVYSVAASAATDYHIQTAGGVKLYAEPSLEGVYTSGQFGWSDGLDVTTAINRFWSRFQNGETLLMQHYVDAAWTTRLDLPENFILKAQKRKTDGFRFTALGTAGQFGADNSNKFMGIHCGTTLTTEQASARYIESDPTGRIGDVEVWRCKFSGPVAHALYMRKTDNLKVSWCDFLDGKWHVTLSACNDAEIAHSYFTGTSDFTGSGGEGIKTIQNSTDGSCYRLRIHHNHFYQMRRDGIDKTGGSQYCKIYSNTFEECGQGVASGGIDIKVQHPSVADVRHPNQNMDVFDNVFIGSVAIIKNGWETDWVTSGEVNATDAQFEQYGSRNINFKNNTFIQASGAGKKPAGYSFFGPHDVTTIGDKFYGGATPFDLHQATNSGSTYFPSSRNVVFKDLTLEDDVSIASQDLENFNDLRCHFACYSSKDRSTGNGIRINSCTNIVFSGNVEVETLSATNRYMFYVVNDSDNIVFELDATYKGSSNHPHLIDLNGVGTSNTGTIEATNCKARGFDSLVRARGTSLDELIVRNNSHMDAQGPLVELSTSSVPAITNAIFVGNVSDGAQAVSSGALSSGTPTTGENYNFA